MDTSLTLFLLLFHPASYLITLGINVSLFFIYLYIARYKRRTPRLSRTLLFSAIAMILFSTVHVSLGFRRLLEGFIYLDGGPEPGGPAAYFSDVSLPLNVAKVVVHTVNSIVGDGIVVSNPHIGILGWWLVPRGCVACEHGEQNFFG